MTVFYPKSHAIINKLIDNLKESFLLERKEDMAGFLGLKIDRSTQGILVLTQTGLMDRMLL